MNIAKVIPYDLVNGEGIGLTIFISGCEFQCVGCYNKIAWDFNYGSEYNQKKLDEIMQWYGDELIDHMSIMGGEPLHPKNLEGTRNLLSFAKMLFPHKKVWLWTGYTKSYWKRLQLDHLVDIIIDGKYENNNPTKKLWRGSDNQKMWEYGNGIWNCKG